VFLKCCLCMFKCFIMFCMSVRILLVWYLMNIMVSLVNTSRTRTVLLQVSKDV